MPQIRRKTGRRVSFEYTLIKDVNDSKENALELATRLKGMNAHVNLIPVNDVKERGNIKSSKKAILNFQNILKKRDKCYNKTYFGRRYQCVMRSITTS